ncbi:MAG: DUF2236 domain-containing protein [Acidobacteriota bacterium]|nr:DUF2236 domain-containing protein [Acidobacteriota bacterium]MDE3147706.1 DUF2236 domain-containing protein [Acidobacteriota bacterium]
MLMPAAANVVMQLSRPGVGRGVAESRVASGSLMRRPLKRLRTTLAYIWVALYGSEDERREMRRGVDAQHRHVRSRPDDEVAYDAYDAELQLWVATCMFVGSLQGYETLYGRANEEVDDTLLAQCSRFATTLQVPAGQWPRDRAAFDHYWSDAMEQVAVDEVTRAYLGDFLDLVFLPRPLAWTLRPLHRLLTIGYLAPSFREVLGWSWSPRDERRFGRVCAAAKWVNRVAPGPIGAFPWNLVRFDTRRRIARRRPLV